MALVVTDLYSHTGVAFFIFLATVLDRGRQCDIRFYIKEVLASLTPHFLSSRPWN